MNKFIKIAAVMLVGAMLSACSGFGEYVGPSRGIDLQIDSIMWGAGGGVKVKSLTYKRNEKPIGTLTITQGTMEMTGPGVEILARMMFCDKAPLAAECTGGPSTPSLIGNEWPEAGLTSPAVPNIPVTTVFE